ncbi:hypothetical protein LTSEJOH_1424, partial [Salmonella enterica subsp. enterica serovar Johannesburg str. S5-703]
MPEQSGEKIQIFFCPCFKICTAADMFLIDKN